VRKRFWGKEESSHTMLRKGREDGAIISSISCYRRGEKRLTSAERNRIPTGELGSPYSTRGRKIFIVSYQKIRDDALKGG